MGNSFYVELISQIPLWARLFAAEVSLVSRFVPGTFTACPGIDVAKFFQRESIRWNVPGHLDGGVICEEAI